MDLASSVHTIRGGRGLKILASIKLYKHKVDGEWIASLNPIRTGGVFHQARGFLPITLEIIKVHSRNLLTFPKM